MIKRHISKLDPDKESLQIAIEKMNMEVGQIEHSIKELKTDKLRFEQEIEKIKGEIKSLEAQYLTGYENLQSINQ